MKQCTLYASGGFRLSLTFNFAYGFPLGKRLLLFERRSIHCSTLNPSLQAEPFDTLNDNEKACIVYKI